MFVFVADGQPMKQDDRFVFALPGPIRQLFALFALVRICGKLLSERQF